MNPTPEQLDAIIDAGKRATRFIGHPTGCTTDESAYIALAANHAPALAAEVKRLRAERERIRAILGRDLERCVYQNTLTGDEFISPTFTLDEARELAELVKPEPHG